MSIQAISSAATVAIVCAIAFFVATRSWFKLTRVLTGHPSFADSILSEAAERFRWRLQDLSRRQASYAGAGLVFVIMYGVSTVMQSPLLFADYPAWQLYPLLACLVAAALYALYRLLRSLFEWRQVRFLHDANIAVGHQLQRVAAEHGRVFHDVPTKAGVVDHVMIGANGIYAINVVARRPVKQGSVGLAQNKLVFSGAHEPHSVTDIAATTNRLTKEFCDETGHDIRVRSVIAVPGWNIEDQADDDLLLVNERTLPMLRGWKDEADYLLNEDVNALQNCLTERCTRSKTH